MNADQRTTVFDAHLETLAEAQQAAKARYPMTPEGRDRRRLWMTKWTQRNTWLKGPDGPKTPSGRMPKKTRDLIARNQARIDQIVKELDGAPPDREDWRYVYEFLTYQARDIAQAGADAVNVLHERLDTRGPIETLRWCDRQMKEAAAAEVAEQFLAQADQIRAELGETWKALRLIAIRLKQTADQTEADLYREAYISTENITNLMAKQYRQYGRAQFVERTRYTIRNAQRYLDAYILHVESEEAELAEWQARQVRDYAVEARDAR